MFSLNPLVLPQRTTQKDAFHLQCIFFVFNFFDLNETNDLSCFIELWHRMSQADQRLFLNTSFLGIVDSSHGPHANFRCNFPIRIPEQFDGVHRKKLSSVAAHLQGELTVSTRAHTAHRKAWKYTHGLSPEVVLTALRAPALGAQPLTFVALRPPSPSDTSLIAAVVCSSSSMLTYSEKKASALNSSPSPNAAN